MWKRERHNISTTRAEAIADRTHLSDPLWMLGQKHLERMQLLRDALDVVQPVHADDDLATLEPVLELFEPVVDLGVAQSVDKLHRLDTDGVSPDLGVSAFKLDSVGHGLEAEDAGARGEEVAGVVVCVEAARVRGGDTPEGKSTTRSKEQWNERDARERENAQLTR
jgi:hypothetical protein